MSDSFRETILLFVFSISQIRKKININTLQRYLYLYYITGQFLQEEVKSEVTVYTDRHFGIKISGFSEEIDRLVATDFLSRETTTLCPNAKLVNWGNSLSPDGLSAEKLKEIQSFVNLLTSYDDDTVFSLLFEEPSVKSAKNRNIEVSVSNSELSELLNTFYDSITEQTIEKYDVLSHWLNFIIQHIQNDKRGETVD
ncbi:hypothetical protein EI999_02695 [Streptococcus suis]|uniref:hypothetical protein n=1 Tax=Streptococcus suis TaxID=1307 RepID=UPI000CF5CFEE|nr:hypothetical protein [Streptococcus suis]NQO84007.1 hypothetical protein [Streptococcus suis]RRR53338.1 hypothetical protein EI999_02695 [Streptococcus suis]HEL2475175.1 hypothetical protein [Streptococcus suis]HEM5043069.1 hypothetical protein [Streptococcus suis]HEM5078811.1 hypothetical protein [Streptococcus suis]